MQCQAQLEMSRTSNTTPHMFPELFQDQTLCLSTAVLMRSKAKPRGSSTLQLPYSQYCFTTPQVPSYRTRPPEQAEGMEIFPTGKPLQQHPALGLSERAELTVVGFILTAHSARYLAHCKQKHRFSGHSKFFHFRNFPAAGQLHSLSPDPVSSHAAGTCRGDGCLQNPPGPIFP